MEKQKSQIKKVIEIKHDDPSMLSTVKRLHDLGICQGLEVEILKKTSFNSVTILKFEQTLIALNQEEMSCLKF